MGHIQFHKHFTTQAFLYNTSCSFNIATLKLYTAKNFGNFDLLVITVPKQSQLRFRQTVSSQNPWWAKGTIGSYTFCPSSAKYMVAVSGVSEFISILVPHTSRAASILASVCSETTSCSDTSSDVFLDDCNVLTSCSSSKREPWASLSNLWI